MLVQVHSLSRSFGHGPTKVDAVKQVSFQFDRGEIFGFIGPNGAGKSTTMRILASLDLPTSGDCTVAGLSTIDDADRVRRLIGYMPDSYGAYPNMTVWEYLDFFSRAYDMPIDRRTRAVGDVIDFCQLGGLREKLVTTLSKGMKQRLCLGRCLIHDPQLLILDEPSAGLDPRARIEFRELLRLLAGQGKAIFISSHILAELEELCDAVAIIEQGALVAAGKVREIKAAVAHKAQVRAAAEPDTATETIEIRLAAPVERLAAILAEQPELAEVQNDHLLVTARCPALAATQAALLKRLIEAGLPVCRFAARERNLEDLFMHLTEGKVA